MPIISSNEIENNTIFRIIYELYKTEFENCCENILIDDKDDLLSYFFSKMNLIIKNNLEKNFSIDKNSLSKIIQKCEMNFISEVYTPMHNICSFTLNKFLISRIIKGKTKNKNGGISNQYLINFLPHCIKEKTPIHICGKKFIQVSENNIKYAICIWCKKCYFGNLILMHCSNCNINYYSKILEDYYFMNKEVLYPATWEKYHCNIVKNEQMSCIQCNEKLWIKNNNLFCKICKIEINPLDISWICSLCQKEFKSKIKIYNSLEFKMRKIKIRDAFLYKKIVKPKSTPCKCVKEEEINKIDFYHKLKEGCHGVMYYTQFGNNHFLVCSSCSLFCSLEEFKWHCPLCFCSFSSNAVKVFNNNKIERIINTNYYFEKENKKKFISKNNINNRILTNLEENNNKAKNEILLTSINNWINENSVNDINTNSKRIKSYNHSISSKSRSKSKSKSKSKNNSIFIKISKISINQTLETTSRKIKENEKGAKYNQKILNMFKKFLGGNKLDLSKNGYNEQISYKLFNSKIISNIKNKNILKNHIKNNHYSLRNNILNNFSFENKGNFKGPVIDSNNKNYKTILKNDSSDSLVNEFKKNISYATSNKIFIKHKKKENRKNNLNIKENSQRKNNNILLKKRNKEKSKISLLNLNLAKTFVNHRNRGKNKIKNLLNGNISYFKNNLKMKYKLYKNKSPNKKKFIPNLRMNNKKLNTSLSKEYFFKREVSLPYKTEGKRLFENEANINIKYKLKNPSEPKLRKIKNNILKNNANIKQYFEKYKKRIKKFNISYDYLYKNNYFNRSIENYSFKKNKNIIKNNILNNEKSKKRNISPSFNNKYLTQSLLNKSIIINFNYFSNLNKSDNSLVHFYESKKPSKIEKILKKIKTSNSKVDNKKFSKNNLNKMIDNQKNIKKKRKIRNIDKNIESSMNSIKGVFESNLKIENAYSNKGFKDYKEKECNNKEFNLEEYKIITQLGQGTFSKIYLVQDKNKNLYSMKKIILSDELDIKSAIKEYQISSKLEHENIVKLLGIYTTKLDITTYVVYILMELGKTDWEKEIRSHIEKKIYYKEIDLISIIKQLIGAFSFLQKNNVVHRDIKPQNILIFKDNKYKLADFGESKEISNIDYSLLNGSLRGTELYMSPLLLNGLRNGQIEVKHNLYKSDVYSFGLCLLYASTSCYKNLYDIRKIVDMKELAIFIENNLKNKYCKKVIDLIISMLEIHEEKRPDFIELERIIDKLFP